MCLRVKSVGKPDAGNRHVRFDERGEETGGCQFGPAPRLSSTLPEQSFFYQRVRSLVPACRSQSIRFGSGVYLRWPRAHAWGCVGSPQPGRELGADTSTQSQADAWGSENGCDLVRLALQVGTSNPPQNPGKPEIFVQRWVKPASTQGTRATALLPYRAATVGADTNPNSNRSQPISISFSEAYRETLFWRQRSPLK